MFNAYKNYMNRTFRDAQRHNLIGAIAPLFPTEQSSVIDIGCGNGEFASMLQEKRPNLTVQGCEVIDRGHLYVPITYFDGITLPFADNSFDYAMMINMLHHTDSPEAILREAIRVSRKGLIIKDHYANNMVDRANLHAMEYMNPNFREIMKLPLRFYSSGEWDSIMSKLGLTSDVINTDFVSYGRFWDLFFGRNMHFVGRYHIA